MKKLLQLSPWRVLPLSILSLLWLPGHAQHYARASNQYVNPITLDDTQQTAEPYDNRSLNHILMRLSEQYKVNFNYDYDIIKQITLPESFSWSSKEKLDRILRKLLGSLQLQFEKVNDKSYLIFPAGKEPGTRDEDPKSFRQHPDKTGVSAADDINPQATNYSIQDEISGRVIDENGEAVPGANVLIKGTTNGTTTDSQGLFRLSIPNRDAVLVISFIGYVAQEIAVGNLSEINVSLVPDIRSLNEVVVIGYGQAKKEDLTGSVAPIQVDEIKKVALTSLDQSLQGRAAGVQITQNSASPGGSTTIRIRGGNSIQGDNEPLYVIDGVPFKNGGADSGSSFNVLSTLNPNDIESMTVLKDASSTAIYGSRGANGVVIINTKRGKSGKATVNFESYYGLQQVRRKYPLLNAAEYATMVNDANLNEGKAAVYTQEQVDAFGKGTDWQDEILRDAPISNYQLTLTGGDDKTQYAIAGGYFKQEGIVINSNFDRASFRVNLDRKLSNKIKIGNSLSLNSTRTNQSRTDGDLGSAGQVVMNALQFPSILPVRTASGAYLTTDPALSFTIDNPVALANDGVNRIKASRVLGNVFGEYQIIEGLSLKVSLGIDGIFQKQDTYLPKTVVSGSSQGGYGSISNNNAVTWLNENILSYTKTFSPAHKINAIVGYTLQANRTEGAFAAARNFVNDDLATNNLGSGSVPLTPSSSINTWGLESYLSRVNYTLKEKYLLTVSFRVDGSSRFGSNKRYGYFPSAALAWRIKEESFLSAIDFLSDFKLRTSYGVTGNQDGIGNYPAYSLLSTQNYVFGGTNSTGIGPSQIANPDLSWEMTKQFDAGVDLGFFNDRITLTADVYYKRTDDLLLNVTIPATSGYTSAFQNLGSLENKGLELSVNSNNLEGDFKWNTNINWALNRSKVLSIGRSNQIFAGGVANIAQNVNSGIIRVGEPLGSFYGYVTDGVYQTVEELAALPDASARKPGDRKYKDIFPDNKIDDNDRTIIGRAQPKWIGGMTNTFSYKGIELTVFLQGVYGNDILNANRFELEYLNGTTNQSRDVLNRWTPANTDTDIPRASTTRPANRISTRQIEDGSYLRLKNVQLAYNLPNTWFENKIVSSLRIYGTLQNFATWTNYSGYDPEVNRFGQDSRSQGFDYGGYPAAKTFLFGVNIGL